MPEFILDHGSAESARVFRALDSFTQGYIEAMFFTDEEQLCEESGREMPSVAINTATMESRFVGGDSPGFGDLAPETLARIVADCAKFRDDAKIMACIAQDDEKAGRDFWYTRNGHGCGFWDGDWPEPDATYLDARADTFGNVDSYVGDDGLIYIG